MSKDLGRGSSYAVRPTGHFLQNLLGQSSAQQAPAAGHTPRPSHFEEMPAHVDFLEGSGLMEDMDDEGFGLQDHGSFMGSRSVAPSDWSSKMQADNAPPGRALMEEVLSQFTDFAPQSSVKSARVGRGMAGAPVAGSWSNTCTIEQRHGRRYRKYQMQALDRGADSIARPGTAPPPYLSPGSPLFNSSLRSQSATPGPSSPSNRLSPTPDSPARERVPRTAQQFPAIVSAGVTSSSMTKAQNQDRLTDLFKEAILPLDLLTRKDGQRPYLMTSTDEEKPPFRLNHHPHLLERKVGEPVERQHQYNPLTDAAAQRLLTRKSTHTYDGRLANLGKRRSARGTNKGTEKIAWEKNMSISGRRATGANIGLHFNMGHEDGHHPKKAVRKRSLASILANGSSSSNSGMARSQRPSKYVESPLNGLNSGSPGAQNDEAERPKNGIWKLNLQSSKDDRLERLNIHRKIKESELLVGDRDKVVTREEVELAEDSFYRYYKKSTFHEYNQELVLAALADFGIRARTRPEKLGLLKVLVDYEDTSKEFSFKDFCSVVEESRVKMRSVRFSSLFLAWRNVDTDDIGALDRDQIIALLELLNALPADQGEACLVDTWIEDLHKDTFGLISLGEVEYLVQQCREHQESTRRRAERHIQEQYHLAGKTFHEFRSQLIDLHDAFTKVIEETSGSIGVEEVYHLLAEFGITTLSTGMAKSRLQDHIKAFMSQAGDVTKIAFPWLLMFVRTLRKAVMEDRSDEVRTLFVAYDKDRSDALDMKEICMILVDLNLQPRSPSEQDGIAELLEEVDFDGTGTLCFDELLTIVVRISERIAQVQRTAENLRAEALGFTRQESGELRRAFEALDADDSGCLSSAEIFRAVHWMQWKVSEYKLHQLVDDVDEDGSGHIDFSEFLELMRRVDDDVKATGDERPVVETQKKEAPEKGPPEAPSSPTHSETPEKQIPDKAAALRRRRGKAAVHASMAGISVLTKTVRGTVIRPSG
mmetsp:Transcript_106026/g.204026  ORF Transcript_106026/g.204026 Transcript_106026/m.204026 type:complete len:988 (+) Transcript_106026:108-3071(+)